MRLETKYKKFATLNINKLDSLFFPKKLLIFKRAKWKNCQKRILSSSKKRKLSLTNPLIYRLQPRVVENVKNYYIEGLRLKIFLQLFFDYSLKTSFFKKLLVSFTDNKSLKTFLIKLFLKPYFRVDILLWKLKIFNSSFSVRQYINEGKILINSHRIKSNYILKKGDIISFKNNNINLFLKFCNLTPILQIYTFIEVDYYLKRIILIKNLTELNHEDLNVMVKKFFNINKLQDYIKK